MKRFRDVSIKWKLMAVLMATTGMALLLSGIGIVAADSILFRKSTQESLSTLAMIIADNSTAALAFKDPVTATNALASLKAKPQILLACIYSLDGSVFAQYSRPEKAVSCPSAEAAAEPGAKGTEMRVSRSIMLQNRRLGTLFLLYDLSELRERQRLFGGTVAAVLLVSSIIALLLSGRLRAIVTRPISLLANATKTISDTRNYGIRVQKFSGDEIGLLVDGFNEMLVNIQSRDAELRAAHDELEERVRSRTEELRQSEERFRLLVDRVEGYAIVALDPTGHVSSWNAGAQRINGYRAEEIIGRRYSDFYPPEDASRGIPERNLEIAAEEGRFEGEGWRLRKDGSPFWASVVITALRNPEGDLVGFSKITRDLTERRRVEEAMQQQSAELSRSNADLEQFAYVASHDLQEPLRMVVSYMQLIADQYQGKLGKDADEFIGFAVDGASRMRQLITDLLAYSRLGAHERLGPIDCNTIVDQTRANLDLAIQESGAVITSDRLPTIVADPSQIAHVFQNLLGNAIKFRGPEPPRVHVSAKRDGMFWRFSVADNGIGLAPEYHDRIFVIFQRLHNRLEYPGTGIGLAICRKVVDRLGGRIWVESEPGRGSTFYFTVPASKSASL